MLREYRGSLIASMTAHFLHNGTITLSTWMFLPGAQLNVAVVVDPGGNLVHSSGLPPSSRWLLSIPVSGIVPGVGETV